MNLSHALLRRAPQVAGPLIGILIAATLVWQASDAAFTSTTSNDANSFAAGTVVLVDDDAGSAVIQLANMVPNDTINNCIQVSYTGSSFDLTAVKLYSTLATNVDNFADQLDVKIEEGSGGSFGTCAGFTASSTLYNGTLASLATTHADYTTGITAFTPVSGSVTRTYRVTVTLGSDTPDTSQGDSASANLFWEVHSA